MPKYKRRVIDRDVQNNEVYGGHVKEGGFKNKRLYFPKTREKKAQERLSDVRRHEEDVGLYGQILDLLRYVTGQEASDIKHYEKLQEEGHISERQAYRLIAKAQKDFRKKRGKLENVLLDFEKMAAVVLLAIVTFSLASSILDNPSITGYAVLGFSQATNTTLILNILAFVFVILLVYPTGETFYPVRDIKVKSRTSRRKRK